MDRVFIGVGHGGSDPGAVANGLRESGVNLIKACTCYEELERHGVIVGISRIKDENDPLSQEIAECKAFGADFAIEIHNNAGGGDGFEVYHQTGVHKAKSYTLASYIEQRVIAIGQNSRGIKTWRNPDGSDRFGWLRQLDCPAVLCEGAFLDNINDVKCIDTIAEQQAFGVAYAQAALDYLGIKWRPAEDEADAANILHAVIRQVGAFADEARAEQFAAAMRKQDPNAYWFIQEKRLV